MAISTPGNFKLFTSKPPKQRKKAISRKGRSSGRK